MKKKFSIDIKTANQLEDYRVQKNLSWKEMYAYYFGFGIDQAESVSDKDADALRKQVERKKGRVPHTAIADRVTEPTELSQDKTISYTLKDDEIASASGTVSLADGKDLIADSKRLIEALFTEFNLDDTQYEIVKYTPSFVKGTFKVYAQFNRKKESVYNQPEVVKRYTEILESIGEVNLRPIREIDVDNILVINLADVHWNKMPYLDFDANYLDNFEQMVYNKVGAILQKANKTPIARAAITLGHDFFQTNDSRMTTKKGTEVAHILPYQEMFDTGVRILANIINMVSKYYVTDCYYVLANHDEDSGWHSARELKIMFRNVAHVNVIADKLPFHYIEWGNTLIELKHENLKGGKGSSSMAVVAREAWGRTKYHYTLGGHFHGEYQIKEKSGIVVMGSRALSDTDNWHYLNEYITNIRGLQAYIFTKNEGLSDTLHANL